MLFIFILFFFFFRLFANSFFFSFVQITLRSGCAVDSSVGYLGTGFQSSNGWDPVTGLGTPIFSKLQELATSL